MCSVITICPRPGNWSHGLPGFLADAARRGADFLRSAAMKKGVNKTHGHTVNYNPSKTWRTWCDMRRRCSNPKRGDFYLYGGRGIKVCERWVKFENFLEDMGERPQGMSLGRINNSLGYSKENCRWETSIQQGSNKRNNHLVTALGKEQTVSQWAREIKVDPDVLFCRLRRGWEPSEAVTTPVRPRK